MNKVLLFGGTGKLGTKVAQELQTKNFTVTAVVRNKAKADYLKPYVAHTLITDITKPEALKNICSDFDIVVSTLGKSVSLNDKSKPGFIDIDLNANSIILQEAVAAGIKKFVYVSALGAENCLHLNYFKVHHDFSEKLKHSGIDYSIIKPPAILSAFVDLIDMAKKGQLMNIGKGDKQTNPIYEGDLARILVESILEKNATIEAGGKKVYTRKEINEIIQQDIAPKKKLRSMPAGLVKCGLPLLKIFNKNMYDKFAFFLEVVQHDLIAPKAGEVTLEKYLGEKLYL